MRLDRSKLPHNMTPEQRADLMDGTEADAVAAATIAWLTKGWAAMDSREKQALSSGALV